ncbi:hypothetical protein THRCLA_23347 [Thraustotheca clavata]|uniref:U2A'/phosphoprotein 32 family A C-terminal domain-containing protein n=1 Tax=Thraustotheca clavata TaxID=74557 RepID=A0A1V9Y753_9STRA|nr:hypothetical protein THRCLA_23347 [Thraustotheca clavata]
MDGVRRKKMAGRTLMEVLKVQGMRVVEGTKLNMVGKGIECIGSVASSIARSSTCLYLSQNNLSSLNGLEQFTNMKVLSLGGNLIIRFHEFDRLRELPLKTLYLVGNPICDAPNYRSRIIHLLPHIQTLDGQEITSKERQIASFHVAQDESLRRLIQENHIDIARLEWIVLRIELHKELYEVIFTSLSLLSNDRLPPLDKLAINVDVFLRLWRQSGVCPYIDEIELQLQRVVIRAYQKLLQHPIRKAKQLLQKFGPAAKDRLKNLATPATPTWEEAYASVLAVQQHTIAKLRGLCERNRRELIDSMKSLLVKDSKRRLATKGLDIIQTIREKQDQELWKVLPPQQDDPDLIETKPTKIPRRKEIIKPQINQRCGEFTNMTLGEAVKKFEFRHLEPTCRKRSPKKQTAFVNEEKNKDKDEDFENREAIMRLQVQLMEQSLQERQEREECEKRERELQIKLLEYEHQIRQMMTAAPTNESVDKMPINQNDLPNLQHSSSINEGIESTLHKSLQEAMPRQSFKSEISNSLQKNGDNIKERWKPNATIPSPKIYLFEGRANNERNDNPPLYERSSEVNKNFTRSSRTKFGYDNLRIDQDEQQSEIETQSYNKPSTYRPPNFVSYQENESLDEPKSRLKANSTYSRSSCIDKNHERQEAPTPRLSNSMLHVQSQNYKFENKRKQSLPTSSLDCQVLGTALWSFRVKRIFKFWRSFMLQQQVLHQLEANYHFQRMRRLYFAWKNYTMKQKKLILLQQKHLKYVQTRCFELWANYSRFAAITKYALHRRTSTRLSIIFQAWQMYTKQSAAVALAEKYQGLSETHRKLKSCFRAWHIMVIILRLQKQHRRYIQRSKLRLIQYKCFHQWRTYAQSRLRPRKDLEHQVISTHTHRKLFQTLKAWKMLHRANILSCKFLRRHAWQSWLVFQHREQTMNRLLRKTTRNQVKRCIGQWFETTETKKQRDRLVNIAHRHAITHILKRVWRYWTKYKTMRKKYIQGYIKAFKHYSVKLQRKCWYFWAFIATHNLRHRRMQKQTTLRRVFYALRQVVVLEKLLRQSKHNFDKLQCRRAWNLLRSIWNTWSHFTRKRHIQKSYYMIIQYRREAIILTRLWGKWMTQFGIARFRHVKALGEEIKNAHESAEEANHKVLTIEQSRLSLHEEIAKLQAQLADKDSEIKHYRDMTKEAKVIEANLKDQISELQSELAQNQQLCSLETQAFERDRSELNQMIEKHASDTARLQTMVLDIRSELVSSQNDVQREKTRSTHLAEEINEQKNQIGSLKMTIATLETKVEATEQLLTTERNERQEAAIRCQEYEHRLGETCRDIQHREEETECELRELQDNISTMEQKWKASELRNAELLKLVQEKNSHIAALTAQVEKFRAFEEQRMTSLLDEVQANIKKKVEYVPDNNQVNDEILQLNAHTKTVHEDIRSLQERLLHRLHQAPYRVDSPIHRSHDAPPMSPIPESAPVLKKPLSTRNLYSFDVKWGVIPPAELEIIRMKKESQSMFAKKKHHQNDSCSHGLGDIPIFTSSDRLEDEIVKATEPGAVEAWVNAHLLKGAIQLIPLSDAYIDTSDEKKKQAMMYQSKLEYNDIQKIFASPDKSPLEGAGIDSGSLLRLGMPKAIVERIYRGLFVYSSGFHSLIHDIGRHCPAYAESHIAANIWLTFLHLLEKCEDGRYEMAMLKFNHATAVWKRNAINEYEQQEQALKAAVDVAKGETEAQKVIVSEREAVIATRDQTIEDLRKEVAEAHECTAQTEDQVRLANLEILELENTLARTRKELDQTMQSLHIALSEKTNLEVEVTSYQNELQNSEARVKKAHEIKIKTAERIRELQSTAQELRNQLEKSKNDLNITAMDQAKTSVENDELICRTNMLETKVKSLTAHLFILTTDLNKRTTEVEERDATLLSLKQAMEKDRENFAGQTAELARLNALVAAQKRDYMVLEAQAQLLLMEKKNSNMREGDRLRIERLLNKKVELEKEVEGLRIEKEKSQEHIWNLRAALETLENDLHLSKRAFATSQTSLQQLDKVNDQLRNQLQEMERNVDRMTVGFNAMKDRCKMVEDSAKEQIDKVEMELKVAMAQMREMAYVRRENETQINDLAKTIDVHIMETKIMRQRYEQSEKVTASLVLERDSLLREKRVIQLEYNANQLVMTKLQESTSSLMGRIRKHEVTFDEAISELKIHYEEALAVGHKHLEPSLQSEPQMNLPNKFAADVMHNSVVTVMV